MKSDDGESGVYFHNDIFEWESRVIELYTSHCRFIRNEDNVVTAFSPMHNGMKVGVFGNLPGHGYVAKVTSAKLLNRGRFKYDPASKLNRQTKGSKKGLSLSGSGKDIGKRIPRVKPTRSYSSPKYW
jgi:hypothetical protein